MAVLDTSILIDLRGRGGARRQRVAQSLIQQLLAEGEILMTTRMNVAELYAGVFRSEDVEQQSQHLEDMLQGLVVLEFDAASSVKFGEIKATLTVAGRKIGDADVVIGSIALVNGESLVTHNASHYSRIPGLDVRSY